MKLTKRVLYHTAKPVDFQYPVRNQVLADQMLDFMRLSRGIGLAATQIGQIKKLLSWRYMANKKFVLIRKSPAKAKFLPIMTKVA